MASFARNEKLKLENRNHNDSQLGHMISILLGGNIGLINFLCAFLTDIPSLLILLCPHSFLFQF